MATFKISNDARKRDEGRAEERTERERADEIANVRKLLGSSDRNEQDAAITLLDRAARKHYFWPEIDVPFVRELAKNNNPQFAKDLWNVAMGLYPDAIQHLLQQVGDDPDLPIRELAVTIAEKNPHSTDELRHFAESIRQRFPKPKDPKEPQPQQVVGEIDLPQTIVYWTQKVDIDTESDTALGKVDATQLPYVRIPYGEYKTQARQFAFGTIVVVRDLKNQRTSYGQYAGSAGAERTDRYAISQKLARDFGRRDLERDWRWPGGEIAFQFFPNAAGYRPLLAEEIAGKGRVLQTQAWLPLLLRYSDASLGAKANELKMKLLQADSEKALPAFNLPNAPEKTDIQPPDVTEIRYFREQDVGAAWDVLDRLRRIDGPRFAPARLSYRTGYQKPPPWIEVFLTP